MMTKNPASKSVQPQLCKVLLTVLVDPKHELVLRAKAIDRSRFERHRTGHRTRPGGQLTRRPLQTCRRRRRPLHALLTAVGFNLRKLMKGLKRLFLCLFPCSLPMFWPVLPQAT